MRRCVRKNAPCSACHAPLIFCTVAPTTSMPDGIAIRIGASVSVTGRVTACTRLPSMRAATAMHNDTVSGSARCGWPLDNMRPVRSTVSPLMVSPDNDGASCGPETKPTKGTTRFCAASAASLPMPIAIDAAIRILPSLASKSADASSASGSSVPVNPRSAAFRKQQALAASTSEARIFPTPGTSSVSTTLPVGSNLPVVAPPGSRNSSLTGEPVPDTPGISRSPSTADMPSSSAKRACMIFFVFVLCTRTSASLPEALSRPSSTANGPIADDMLPQLPL